MNDPYVDQVNEAVAYIQSKAKDFSPKVAITLGSGLGKLASLIVPVAEIAYADIPHFPSLTVPGHEGKLILGMLEGIPVVGLKGRKHYYEVANVPNAMDIVTFPVQVAATLGCSLYIATNAAGGLNPSFAVGDVMVISSHIGFFMPNPLLGPHHDFDGNFLFQPQSGIYNERLRKLFLEGSEDVREGVYAAVTGRTYESVGESLLLKKLGVDAVGMSTVPEVIVATNRGLDTFAASIITNAIAQDGTNATNHEEVTAILNSPQTEERLRTLFRSFFTKLHSYKFKK
jgi:purine-nucleoside phosphorylase